MTQLDTAALAERFTIGMYDPNFGAKNPFRAGPEQAMADYGERARTAQGRQSLIDDYLAGGFTKAVDARNEAYGGLLMQRNFTTAYKEAEAQLIGNVAFADRREDLTNYARTLATAAGKPFEEVGPKEAWGSPATLREPTRAAQTFEANAFDHRLEKGHPMREGGEAAVAEYAEKARTAEGRRELVRSVERGDLTRVVDEHAKR